MVREFFGVIQTTEITLREIWLLSFAAWRAIEAYSGIIWCLTYGGLPFNWDEVAALDGQQAADDAFDAALSKARDLRDGGNLNSFEWPREIPEPAVENTFSNIHDAAAFQLACIAAAYIFLHEIQHVQFGNEGNRPSDPCIEELECDRCARSFLFEKIDVYAQQSGEPVESIRAKRALGIAVAKTILLEVTPLTLWAGTDSHPAVGLRVKSFLEDLAAPATDSFWIGVASFLAATCRSRGRLPPRINFGSARELAFLLVELL